MAEKSYFVSWSGGKDCCLALSLMWEQYGKPRYLLTMLTEEGQRSRSHGLKKELLQAQAHALGVPIVFFSTSWEDYEKTFLTALTFLKEKGIEAGVFGDMKFSDSSVCKANRHWPEKVCEQLKMECLEPLWDLTQKEISHLFTFYKIQAYLIAVKKECLSKNYLGALFSDSLAEEIKNLGHHPFGEGGEYHTLVTFSSLFSTALPFKKGQSVLKDGCWFVDVEI